MAKYWKDFIKHACETTTRLIKVTAEFSVLLLLVLLICWGEGEGRRNKDFIISAQGTCDLLNM